MPPETPPRPAPRTPTSLDTEGVRARAGMYFGATDYRLAMAKVLTQLITALLPGGSRPVALDLHPDGSWAIRSEDGASDPGTYLTVLLEAVGTLDSDLAGDGIEITFVPTRVDGILEDLGPIEHQRMVGSLRPVALAAERAIIVRSGQRITTLDLSPATLALELGAGRFHRFPDPWTLARSSNGARLRGAVWWAADGGQEEYSVVNSTHASHGGSHVRGFWRGWWRALTDRVAEAPFGTSLEDLPAPGDQVWNATVVLCLDLEEVQWGPATRCCVQDDNVEEAVERMAHDALLDALRTLPPGASRPPWLKLSDVHWNEPWLDWFPRFYREGFDTNQD